MSSLCGWQRYSGARRNTSTAPLPSNVKSVKSRTTTPGSSKQRYVPGASSRRLAFTRRHASSARMIAAAFLSLAGENPKSTARTTGPPVARGASMVKSPAPAGSADEAQARNRQAAATVQ